MDLTDTIIPKSDQVDAVDFASGPRTVTITGIRAGNSEQPVQLDLAEFPGRPWRPSKSMRRILVAAWGADGHAYVGRRLTLYCDPTVKFGGIAVGGTRISHMSDLKNPLDVALLVTRGKSAVFHVEPLREAKRKAPTITPEQVTACTSIEELRGMWQAASPDVQQLIQQRVAEIQAQVSQMPAPEDDGTDAA